VEHLAAGAPISSAWLAARLAAPARELGVELGAPALEPLAGYASLVLAWGARINLTGAKTPERLADEHLADALALLRHLPAEPFRFVDVGSGAGLPGLVLALMRPRASGVLLEPVRKKHAFLAHAVRELGLGGRIEARAERDEAHAGAGSYDAALSRATWRADLWLERGRRLPRPGGRVLGFEGATPGPLPPGATRHPYALHGKRRAILVREV
jgi:16S rRNA (guanine527-N7)-methyltransferase